MIDSKVVGPNPVVHQWFFLQYSQTAKEKSLRKPEYRSLKSSYDMCQVHEEPLMLILIWFQANLLRGIFSYS